MQRKNTKTLWTENFIRLLILVFFMWSGIAITNSTFSVYVVNDYHGTTYDVSLVSSVMIVTSLLFRPFAGYLIDRFGRRINLALSLGLTAVISLAFLLPKGVAGLVLLRAIMGIPFAMNTTALSTLRSDLIPEEHRAIGFNISTIVIMLSALVIGPNLGYWISGNHGFGVLYASAAGLLFIAVGSFLMMKFADIKSEDNHFSLWEIFEPRAIWFAIIMGTLFMGWPGVLTYGPLYSLEVGLAFGGTFFLSFGIGLILSQFIARLIIGEERPPAFTALAILLVITGHCIIGFTRNQIGFLAGAVFIGAGYGLSFSIFTKLAFDMVVPERRGRCAGTLYIAQDIGATIGIYAYSFVAELTGTYSTGYLMAGAASIIPAAVLLTFALPDYARKRLSECRDELGREMESRIIH